MNMHKKRIARRGAAFVCAFGVALSAMPVHAAEVKSLEDKTSNLQSQLEGINQDLVTLRQKRKLKSRTMKYTAWRHHFRFLVITRKSSMKR